LKTKEKSKIRWGGSGFTRGRHGLLDILYGHLLGVEVRYEVAGTKGNGTVNEITI